MKVSNIAYFISPHGLGHAARACAVMEAIHALNPDTHFEIFTQVPLGFINDSLADSFAFHSLLTDIGMVQQDALSENIPETLRQLSSFLPFNDERVQGLARRLRRMQCELILCDISPLGLQVARVADIPSMLIENFTWDWIYRGYGEREFASHARYLKKIFWQADFRIQVEPVCKYERAVLVTRPVSRRVRASASRVRARLGIPRGAKAILVGLGEFVDWNKFEKRTRQMRNVYFVISGVSGSARTRDNLIFLPRFRRFFQPDLLGACDAIISKVGYSTVAEAYHAGIPFGFVPRRQFRESSVLEKFVERENPSLNIPEKNFRNGAWLDQVQDLLDMPRRERHEPNGAEEIACFVEKVLK